VYTDCQCVQTIVDDTCLCLLYLCQLSDWFIVGGSCVFIAIVMSLRDQYCTVEAS